MPRLVIYFALLTLSLSPATAKRYSDAEWKAMFVERPKPDYPYELRSRRLTGSGIFRLFVDEQGRVTNVSALQSTGHRELDAEALKAFMRWRAKPGSKREVDMPVTFTLRQAYGR
jgi:TonB family protein